MYLNKYDKNFHPHGKSALCLTTGHTASEGQQQREKLLSQSSALKCHPWEWKSAHFLTQNSSAIFGKHSSHMGLLLVSSCLGLGSCSQIGGTCWVSSAAAEINYSWVLNANMSLKKYKNNKEKTLPQQEKSPFQPQNPRLSDISYSFRFDLSRLQFPW